MTLVYLMQRTVVDTKTKEHIRSESYIMTASSEETLGTELRVPTGEERRIAGLLMRTMQCTDDLIVGVHPKLELEKRVNGHTYKTGPVSTRSELYKFLEQYGVHFIYR